VAVTSIAPAVTSIAPDGFSLAVSSGPSRTVVHLSGELDIATVGLVDRTVRDLTSIGIDHVVLDLARLSFMDSRGLQLLLGLRDDATRGRHTLRLAPGPDAVQRVFALTATTGYFDWD
jgi:anti-sigma B factor antagonist